MNKDERIADLEAANARQTTVSILQSDLINELRREVNLLKDCLKLQSKDGSLVPGVITLLRENMKCESSSPSVSPSPAPQPVPALTQEQREWMEEELRYRQVGARSAGTGSPKHVAWCQKSVAVLESLLAGPSTPTEEGKADN